MSIEDPSLLSAYLDRSLDAAQRERMEAALSEDPELHGELRSLAGLKDRLGRLSRPAAPGDSSDVIVGRVQEWARETRGFARFARPLRPWLVLGPLSAAAAALLISWIFLTYDWTPGFRSRMRAPSTQPPHRPAPSLATAPDALPAPIRLTPVMQGVAGIDPVTDGLRHLHELPFHLLPESNIAGTLTIKADPISVDLLERIDGVIHRSPRVAPYHALLAGLGRHRADDHDAKTRLVYAVPLDPSEFERLRESLRAVLPGNHACFVEGSGEAPGLEGLAVASRVTTGEVAPSASMVPFMPTRVVGDRMIDPDAKGAPAARARREPDAIGMIGQDFMVGLPADDHRTNRQWLWDIFGLNAGRNPAPLIDTTPIYLIRIIER